MTTTQTVLTVIAAMLIGAVATGWALHMGTRPPRPQPPRPGRHRAAAPDGDGFRLAELAAPRTAPTIRARAAVLPMPLHRYPWPHAEGGTA
jgi:hypothetical protein